MSKRRLAVILAADVVSFSSMMEKDEEGTLKRVKDLQRNVIEPQAHHHGGRLVKTTGDGFLIEFGSASAALRCALASQDALKVGEDGKAALRLRIGLNLGEIMADEDGDIFGDDVNIAARLQSLADPGGILVSGKVFDEVEESAICSFASRGKQHVKNIARPVRIYAVAASAASTRTSVGLASMKQEIHYCRSKHGVRLAWAKVGEGPPFLKAANWLNHLELDWNSPVWRHLFVGLAKERTLIRYDARGNGLSDWEVPEVSLDAFIRDLETVVEASGLQRFPLLGISQGAALSVAYAVRYPERVSHLILYGGFALGARKRSPEERAKRDAFITLVRGGWDADESTIRDIFVSQLMPDASPDQRRIFAEQQRRTTSGECAARYLEAVGDFDVRDLLRQVKTPTLAMHSRGDLIAPLEAGRAMASAIPDARFVVLPGRNHVLLEDDPAADRFWEETSLFLQH